ncbi:MAG: hypothetical protein COA97_11825 [Flavobacteriales bacterium]|nr:MAG: hypothetical protein COA97_11825 [Flavobacteriales bacterium]
MKSFLILLIIIPIWINAQTTNRKSNSISENAFVKNEGQFNGRNWSTNKIEYSIKQNGFYVFFSKQGLTYRFDKMIKNPDRDKSNPNSPKRTNISELIIVKWIDINNDVEIISSEEVNHYYSYVVKDSKTKKVINLNHITGYQKLTYKNIYDNIDVEYFIPQKGGIKYNIILHPGANPSQIKMKYNTAHTQVKNEAISIQLNNLKQLEINTSLGNIIEHQPSSYNGKTNKAINSNYVFENNTLSFNLENYNQLEEVIIDPWIVSPNFSGSSAIWEVETDRQGNVYTMGGETPIELKKYNSAGVLQWTYVTPFDTIGGDWLGTLTTDDQGNSYISQGTSPQLERIDNSGNMIWHSNGNLVSNPLTEYWSITFNQDTTQLVVGGTSGTIFPLEVYSTIFNINISDGSDISNFTFALKTNIGPPPNTPEEIRSIAVSLCNQYIYLTHDSIGSIDQDFDTHPTTARTFQVGNQHNLAYKAENFFPQQQNGAPLKALIINDNYIYTHTGDSIHQWDLNGTLLNSVSLPNGISTTEVATGDLILNNAGLDVDSCNNVYAGSSDRVVKFDENLNFLTQVNVSFIVHDLNVNSNGEVIAVGAQFNNTQSSRNGKMEAINMNTCSQFKINNCLITNTNQKDKETYSFNILPNPFNSHFKIDYTYYENNPTISVYNIVGKLIISTIVTSYSTTLDLSNEPNGIYVIQLSDKNQQIRRKIIKQ